MSRIGAVRMRLELNGFRVRIPHKKKPIGAHKCLFEKISKRFAFRLSPG